MVNDFVDRDPRKVRNFLNVTCVRVFEEGLVTVRSQEMEEIGVRLSNERDQSGVKAFLLCSLMESLAVFYSRHADMQDDFSRTKSGRQRKRRHDVVGRKLVGVLAQAAQSLFFGFAVAEAIQSGGDVFAKHVLHADPELRPADETIVIDERGILLGVGRAVLSGMEMCDFRRGVAVKIRRGVQEERGVDKDSSKPDDEK